MEEKSFMNDFMTHTVKNIIAGAYKYKENRAERSKYISDCMKESFTSISWCVIIYEVSHGYGCFNNASTSYYYWCKMNGEFIIVIGFEKLNNGNNSIK